eukprot:scaffold197683_cov31-Tisochrysis_lutea.AAC.3
MAAKDARHVALSQRGATPPPKPGSPGGRLETPAHDALGTRECVARDVSRLPSLSVSRPRVTFFTHFTGGDEPRLSLGRGGGKATTAQGHFL